MKKYNQFFYTRDFKYAKKRQLEFINKIYPMEGNMKKMFNRKESSEYLGISRWTFKRWIDIGLVSPGYPTSPQSTRRTWTREMLDQSIINIENMNMIRRDKTND